MRTVIKGLHHTKIIITSKDSPQETVMYWVLKKPRKPSECGTWIDGKRVEGSFYEYQAMNQIKKIGV